MRKRWLVFMHGDRELLRYTSDHEFEGEREATIAMLAYEKHIPKEEITVKAVVDGKAGIIETEIQ